MRLHLQKHDRTSAGRSCSKLAMIPAARCRSPARSSGASGAESSSASSACMCKKHSIIHICFACDTPWPGVAALLGQRRHLHQLPPHARVCPISTATGCAAAVRKCHQLKELSTPARSQGSVHMTFLFNRDLCHGHDKACREEGAGVKVCLLVIDSRVALTCLNGP